jgi:transposase InsO family protein
MIRDEVVTGMKADTSLAPPACDACIRGKQTHHSMPKLREGNKAEKRLGRVYVDLTGPQSVIGRSGCSYIMNIIDDFSGYHWTRLLKAKLDASRILRERLEVAEIQSGERLCYLVTDNGELRSNEMTCWCAERGITHLFTALHTSAQNGRVERLHRTLMNKARAMRLACNAPLNLWDEFILTAAYLSTLTASKAANG